MKKSFIFFICLIFGINVYSQVVGHGLATWSGEYSLCEKMYPFDFMPNAGEAKGPKLLSFTIEYTFTLVGNGVQLKTHLLSPAFDCKIMFARNEYPFKEFTLVTPRLIETSIRLSCDIYYNGKLVDIPDCQSFCGKCKWRYWETVPNC